MKVSGLNNQSFQPTQKASNGKFSQGKTTSFESLLGEAQDRDNNSRISDDFSSSSRQDNEDSSANQQSSAEYERPTAQANSARAELAQRGPAPSGPPVMQAPQQAQDTQDQDTAAEADYNMEALPIGQGAPALGTPGLNNDRQVSPAVNPAYLNPLGQPAQLLSKDDAANTLTRRVVWNDFLRKMNDLGVSAEDVLKAFGTLSEKELTQPPEQSLDKIVAALGLNGPQALEAKQAFGDLITKTKSKTLGEEFAASSKQMSVSLASQRDLLRKAQMKNLEALDNNFFMNKKPGVPTQPQDKQAVIGPDGNAVVLPLTEMPQENFSGMEAPAMLSGNGLQLPNVPGGLPQANEAAGATANAVHAARTEAAELNGLVNQMQAQQQPAVEDKKSIEQLIQNFNAHSMKAAPEMASAPAAVSSAVGTQVVQAPAHASPEALNAIKNIFAGKGRDQNGDASTDEGDDQSGAQSLGQSMTPEQRANVNDVKGDFGSALAAKGAAQAQPMGVPDLVQQAHMMVRDGGGDMKVTLHPDGLGEVALRVSVTDGKVNVQMITESDEAKKLIERGIGDLKNGLSQNHLQVDSIKVDTATNLGKHLEQQYRDAQRQQTHAQWEQFRQDGGGAWRRSFFDTGVVNPYHSQGQAPRDSAAPVASARARNASAGSRRLDLVA